MDNQTFKIIFKGKLVRGVESDVAQARFAKLFKLSPEKAKLFFDGKSRVLKKSLGMEKANHLRQILKKVGVKVTLEKNDVEKTKKEQKEWEVNEPGVVILRSVQPPQTHVETAHIELSDDIGNLEEKADHNPPEVDIDHIQIDENAEKPIVEPKEVEVPNFNIDELSTAEVGSIMVQSKKTETPDIPVDGIEFDDSDEPIVKKEKIKEPEVDISGISLQVEE